MLVLNLQQRNELIHAQARLPDNRAKRATIKFFVIGDGCLCLRLGANQCDVTASLPVNDEACLFKSLDALRARDNGQFTHAATSTIST